MVVWSVEFVVRKYQSVKDTQSLKSRKIDPQDDS